MRTIILSALLITSTTLNAQCVFDHDTTNDNGEHSRSIMVKRLDQRVILSQDGDVYGIQVIFLHHRNKPAPVGPGDTLFIKLKTGVVVHAFCSTPAKTETVIRGGHSYGGANSTMSSAKTYTSYSIQYTLPAESLALLSVHPIARITVPIRKSKKTFLIGGKKSEKLRKGAECMSSQ